MEFTKELKERLLGVAPAQFGHHIEHGYMHPRIKPVETFTPKLDPQQTTLKSLGTGPLSSFVQGRYVPEC